MTRILLSFSVALGLLGSPQALRASCNLVAGYSTHTDDCYADSYVRYLPYVASASGAAEQAQIAVSRSDDANGSWQVALYSATGQRLATTAVLPVPFVSGGTVLSGDLSPVVGLQAGQLYYVGLETTYGSGILLQGSISRRWQSDFASRLNAWPAHEALPIAYDTGYAPDVMIRDCGLTTPTITPTFTISFTSTATPSATTTRTPTPSSTATATITPFAGCAQYGATQQTGSTNSDASYYFSRVYLPQPVYLNALYALSPAGFTYGYTSHMAFYNDAAGVPGTLVLQTGYQALNQGWNRWSTSPTYLSTGYYWFGVQANWGGTLAAHYDPGATDLYTLYVPASYPANFISSPVTDTWFGAGGSYCLYGDFCDAPFTPTPTFTPVATDTATPSETVVGTATWTPTSTATFSDTSSATPTATQSATPSLTVTESDTSSATPTVTPTASPSQTATDPQLTLTSVAQSWTPTPAFGHSEAGGPKVGPVPARKGVALRLFFEQKPDSSGVELYNTEGQKVTSLNFGADPSPSLATDKLAPGIYYLKIKVDGKISWQKIVIVL